MARERRGRVAEAIVALKREIRPMSLRLDEREREREGTLPVEGEVESEGDV